MTAEPRGAFRKAAQAANHGFIQEGESKGTRELDDLEATRGIREARDSEVTQHGNQKEHIKHEELDDQEAKRGISVNGHRWIPHVHQR